jgi:two-component system capsular synthesis response regulator RcsB
MIGRVLIAEDHESASISVRKTLEDLGITDSKYTFYCDDAFLLAKKAIENDESFDLLITDLSFEEDHRKQKISGGLELIFAVKEIQPDIKILVFSAESNPAVLDALFKELKINAYVRKARHDVKDLKLALEAIKKNKIYLAEELKKTVKQKNVYEFTPFDITLISLLSKGTLQKDIPTYLQNMDIKPSGLSSVEKRLNFMKEALGFTKNEQLVAHCKDFGII